ncbi:MAG: TIGR03435 family protein [Bryobacteraceae bacterium]
MTGPLERFPAVLAIWLLCAPFCSSQVPETPGGFDVASIKRNTSGDEGERIGPIVMGRFNASNMAVEHLIRLAYKVHDFEIVGTPSWSMTETFDIDAKAEGMDTATYEEMRPLLQALLADRFRLSLHRESKNLPIYELGVVTGGLKLLPIRSGSCTAFDPDNPLKAAPGELPRVCGATRMGRTFIEAFGLSLRDLAADLSDIVGRPVVDKTGSTGAFDIQLEFAPYDAAPDVSLPSIFTALQQQLGLVLKSARGPVEVLVIDRLERPSDN